MAVDGDLERLKQIKHIVVLMMENRSFDHMLGYLKRDGMADVEGLSGNETNPDEDGVPVPVFEFGDDQYAFHLPNEPFDESLDPKHGHDSVERQLAGGNQGFVTDFIAEKHPPSDWRDLPMGYYVAKHVRVYDFLARQYCVCTVPEAPLGGDRQAAKRRGTDACRHVFALELADITEVHLDRAIADGGRRIGSDQVTDESFSVLSKHVQILPSGSDATNADRRSAFSTSLRPPF